MKNSNVLVDYLMEMVTSEEKNYSQEDKKELILIIVELSKSKTKRSKKSWMKALNSFAKVYLTKEAFDYISEYLL